MAAAAEEGEEALVAQEVAVTWGTGLDDQRVRCGRRLRRRARDFEHGGCCAASKFIGKAPLQTNLHDCIAG